MSRRTHPKHDTAPVSLYNWHIITFRQVSDHKNCGQKNDGHTGSRCLDKAVLAQGGGGAALPDDCKGNVFVVAIQTLAMFVSFQRPDIKELEG